jgi:glycosyltransferase involved in cell wall biosynthesis
MRGCRVCLHFRKNMAAILDDFTLPVRRGILRVWRSADCYCFLSNRLRDEFIDRLRSRKLHVVIPNPISEKWLRQEPLSRGERTRDLVFLGRWSPEKGNKELVLVMRALGVDRPVRCDIYSDHCFKDNPEYCVCHDWLEEDEVQAVLRESKVLLLPSHAEAYPNVLIQAAACGTPFVSTNIAGILDIVEESQAGLLHDVGDVEGMQKAITRLLTDETLWTDCSRSGRRWVESSEISKIVPRWNRLYEDLGVKV